MRFAGLTKDLKNFEKKTQQIGCLDDLSVAMRLAQFFLGRMHAEPKESPLFSTSPKEKQRCKVH
jgi:hypothetical protein